VHEADEDADDDDEEEDATTSLPPVELFFRLSCCRLIDEFTVEVDDVEERRAATPPGPVFLRL
jgi:hypothetical protein